MHSRCEPCSGEVVEAILHSESDFSIRLYDPKIHPWREDEICKAESIAFAANHDIPFIDADDNKEERLNRAKKMQWIPERGRRCTLCFDMHFGRSNVGWVSKLPVEMIVVPNEIRRVGSWKETLQQLHHSKSAFRLDPILAPIGFGFAASLERFFETRRRHPATSIMMGVGNLTELTEIDSSGINFLLAAICEELKIGSD